MKLITVNRIAHAIQLFMLDGGSYTQTDIAAASGVSRKTLARHSTLIDVIKFSMSIGEYNRCILQV